MPTERLLELRATSTVTVVGPGMVQTPSLLLTLARQDKLYFEKLYFFPLPLFESLKVIRKFFKTNMFIVDYTLVGPETCYLLLW